MAVPAIIAPSLPGYFLCCLDTPTASVTGLALRPCACCCSGLCWGKGWRWGSRPRTGSGSMSWRAAIMKHPTCRRRMPMSGPSAAIAPSCCHRRHYSTPRHLRRRAWWQPPPFLPSLIPPCRRAVSSPVRNRAHRLVRPDTRFSACVSPCFLIQRHRAYAYARCGRCCECIA